MINWSTASGALECLPLRCITVAMCFIHSRAYRRRLPDGGGWPRSFTVERMIDSEPLCLPEDLLGLWRIGE
jgi:hypothetical protein